MDGAFPPHGGDILSLNPHKVRNDRFLSIKFKVYNEATWLGGKGTRT